MGALIRAHDWSATPLGPPGRWPQSLKTAVDLVLGSPLPMAVLWGPELVQIYNDGCAAMAGARHPRALGRRTRECWPELWEFNGPIYAAVLRGETRAFADQKLTIERHGAPEEAWFDLAFSPLRDEAGAVAGVLVAAVEKTAKVQEEAARRRAEETYRGAAGRAGLSADFRALFEASPTPFLVLAPDLDIIAVNDAYLRATLTRREAILGRKLFDVFPDNPANKAADGVRNLRASLERVLATRRPDAMPVQRYDIRRPESAGGGFEERWWSPINTPVLGEGGEVACIIHRAEDVTELVRLRSEGAAQDQLARDQQAAIERARDAYGALSDSEVRLAEEHTRLVTLVDSLPVGVCFFDRTGKALLSNPAFRRFVPTETIPSRMPEGNERWLAWDENGGRLPLDLYPGPRALRGEIVAGVEFLHRPERGREVWTRVSSVPLRDAAGEIAAALLVIVDIDEQKRAQEALRRLNETLESRVAARKAELEALSAERDRLASVAENSSDFIGICDVDLTVIYVNPAGRRLVGIESDEEMRRTTPPDYFVEDERARVEAEVFPAILERGRWVGELTFRHFKTGARIPVLYDAFRVDDPASGAPSHYATVTRDLTERKEAEERLRQAQKMEAVGQLTGGLAHDFNNLLTAILGNLELVEMRLGGDEKLVRPVRAASRAAERGARLTEQLLAFSRRQHLAPKPVNLNSIVGGISELLARTLGGTVAVRTALAGDLWPALVDATQIEVAILNLAINARDAMPLGGTVLIGTRNVGANAPDRPSDLARGDHVALSVTDTGEGMAPEVLAKAFEPFFTTKEVGKGTGLGLSQVYGLARQSGGSARIRSAPGRGTQAEIFVPRAPAAAAKLPPPAGANAGAMPRHGGTVLVVDDQEDVRAIAVSYLEALGYRTLQAANGRAALDLLAGGADVDVMLVDYAMPGISGAEVIRKAWQGRPDLAVVLTTGYAGVEALGETLRDVVLLKKPFRLQDLKAALEAAP
jgi:PAS domain S-box-containing protein